MDYRLDLYNQVKNYMDNANDDDVAMMIIHNKKDGDFVNYFIGDWEILSAALTTEGYINFKEGSQDGLEAMQKSILNIAYNIIMKDEKIKSKFKKALK